MANQVKRLAVFGSTGSIGRQTLDVVRAFPQKLEVLALAAGSNVELLAQQIQEFNPLWVWAESEAGREALSRGIAGSLPNGWELLSAMEMACLPPIDLAVVATAGRGGLSPTLAALGAGKDIALANKEVLVMAGEAVMALAKAGNVTLRPVDSEHSAIWQCLQGEASSIERIILTASGGAFRDLPQEALPQVTPEQALQHPTWQMGRKITIDSATLMNKGMEAIEAHWLFGVAMNDISIVMHRESVVHSLVEFADGSVKAQLSPPDMRLPIQYALSHPERWANPTLPKLDAAALGALHFEPLDESRYPCLRLALEAGREGGTYPAVLCAADEMAVEYFLSRRIGFLDIARLIEQVLEAHQGVSHPSLEDILAADEWARQRVREEARRIMP